MVNPLFCHDSCKTQNLFHFFMARFRFQILLVWLLAVSFLPLYLSAQSAATSEAVWSELAAQIRLGNRRALRDIASFLEKPAFSAASRRVLIEHTFFMPSEINLTRASREEFLTFFYDHEKTLKFSEILSAFYVTPIEFQTSENIKAAVGKTENLGTTPQYLTPFDPSLQLQTYSRQFDSLILKKAQVFDIQQVIEKINALETPESFDWLRRTLTESSFDKTKSELNLSLCEALVYDPSNETLAAVFAATERGAVPLALLSPVILQLTNAVIAPTQYRRLADSLGSLEAVRAYGYARDLPFKEAFFYEKVDYYGKILSRL